MNRRRRLAFVAAAALAAGGCAGGSVAGDDRGIEPLVGSWRGVLTSRGGELPFRIDVRGEQANPPAALRNGGRETPVVAIERQGAGTYRMGFDDPGVEIVAKLSPTGEALSGFWRYGGAGEGAPVMLPLAGSRDDARRFQRNDPTLPIAGADAIAALPTVAGEWRVSLGGSTPGPLAWRLEQDGETVIVDAAMIPSSNREGGADDEPATLEGIYRNGLLRLSSFDGRRALLIHARAAVDGTLRGSIWVDEGPAREWAARPDA